MAARLGAVAAHAHLAPTAASIFALVEEQPAALRVGALLDAIDPGEVPWDLGGKLDQASMAKRLVRAALAETGISQKIDALVAKLLDGE